MILLLDIGNSRTKAALVHQGEWIGHSRTSDPDPDWLERFIGSRLPTSAMLSATGRIPDWLPDWLDASVRWSELTHQTRLPFTNAYLTPQTLGRDRIAALAGALGLGYTPPFLVIDAGTCITADLMEVGPIFQGGSIAPGLRMRLQAMHDQTARLPLAEWADEPVLPGRDTRESLQAGALWGGICEVEGLILRYRQLHPELNIIITGGDADFLAKHVNSVIFAHAELVLFGLYVIAQHEMDAE